MAPHHLLRHQGFLAFWFSVLCSGISLEMVATAVAWQTYDTTGRVADLGLIGLAQFLPALALSLPAGHMADRYDRRAIVMAAGGLGCAVAVALAFLSTGVQDIRLWLLCLVHIGGIASTLRRPALQSLVPQLVPAEALPHAYAAISVAGEAGVIAGPMLGGVMYLAGSTVVYAVAATLLLASILLLLRVTRAPPDDRSRTAGGSDVFAGIRFIREHPTLLGLVSLDLFAVLLGGATALLPVFAKDVLHTGPWGLGILRVAPSIGALIVGAWLTKYPPRRGIGVTMFASVAGFGLATLIFGWSRHLWLSAAALITLGGFDMVSMVIRGTLLQMATPGHMRGRVSAVNGIFISTSNQLGEFESGMLAALIGASPAVMVGGVGTLIVVGIWWFLFPSLRRHDRWLSA